MSEHKSDILSSTGSHRVWVGERSSQDLPIAAGNPARPALPATSRSWVKRPMAVPLTANPRHAAITKNLSHFTNYKSWTEKVKSGWKPGTEQDE